MKLISYMSPGFPRSLFSTIGDVIDAEVTFDETRSGPAPGTDPFRDGSFDLGWICSTSFASIAANGIDPSVVLVGVAWVPDDPGSAGRPLYFGDVVTRRDSGIHSFDQLSGRTIGCNDDVSLSGYYSLDFALEDRGLPHDFVNRVLTGGHHTSLDKVISGEIDAAVVDSVVLRTRARSSAEVSELSLIERLGPWPVQPLVARSSLNPQVIATVREKILTAANGATLAAELRRAGLAALVEVGVDHYQPVREAMERASSQLNT